MKQVKTQEAPCVGYDLRPVVVAADLEELRGPLSGQWRLPLHLDSSAQALYDFAEHSDRRQAYQLVLLEAAEPADLSRWIDAGELLRLWPELYLPRAVRRAWQARHPELEQAGAGPLVPQL